MSVFRKLRSIQFDPLAPVGCNHDLVLQSRLVGYRIGDWEKTAYKDRLIYDGWDKMASLVPFEGWPWRRYFHIWHRPGFDKIFSDHPHAVEAILKELDSRGPLLPREFEFKERKEEWKGSWYGPNVVKVTLRALWHTGQVMTTGRRNGHHVYDLTERVVPEHLRALPMPTEREAKRELIMERHRACGVVRPSAAYEMWSYRIYVPERKALIRELVDEGALVPVNIEGVIGHATPEFLTLLDYPSLEGCVRFVAPLDQLMWDRKLIAQVFDFDYVWEVYVPEAKRKWGYYVLPVLFGNQFVGRVEFYCRAGVLEVRRWHQEPTSPQHGFKDVLEVALRHLMDYCSATRMEVNDPAFPLPSLTIP